MDRRGFLALSAGLALSACTTGRQLSDSESADEVELRREPASSGQAKQTKSFLRSVRLSNPIEQMGSEYDAIVIGSGYGASVIASRLARSFKNLCVLERGQEFQPGDFPDTPVEMVKALKSVINPKGLIDISGPVGSDIDIICGNGLGGTSLINAAISIRPQKNVLLQNEWPEEIRQAAQDGTLDRYYDRAESMLKPASIGRDTPAAKSQLHRTSVQEHGREFGELRLNIRPEVSATKLNEAGYPQGPCVQCGDCCTGCNYGAKNTLVTNYLSVAKANGAEIYTGIEVEKIEKSGSLYLIHARGPNGHRVLKARYVFLGAGSKGSTSILLRSESNGFRFSPALGTRLSANGDVMGVAYNTAHRTNILALGESLQSLATEMRPGPIIASYGDYRTHSLDGDVESQFLLLDGVVPSSLKGVVAKALATYALASDFKFNDEQLRRIHLDQNGFDSNEDGALNHSMLYFACGHDSSGGRYRYHRTTGQITYEWKNVTQEKTFVRINSVMKDYANRLGALFIPNPRSTVFGQRIQATHPLGGCPMGSDVRHGVVDHLGQVFNPMGGYYDNLYVVDASIIPRSLSATPLLTITALAERIADGVLSRI